MNSEIIKGSTGKISLMRTMGLVVVVSIMGIFITHNILSMIKGGGFVSIGTQEAMLIAGVLGAKAAQRFGENKVLSYNEGMNKEDGNAKPRKL